MSHFLWNDSDKNARCEVRWKAPIPCGVNTDDMLAALESRSLSQAGLIQASTLVTQAGLQFEAARENAKSQLDAFVAALGSPG